MTLLMGMGADDFGRWRHVVTFWESEHMTKGTRETKESDSGCSWGAFTS